MPHPLLRYGSVPTVGTPPVYSVPDTRPSQFNDYYQRKLAMPYGRPLRGLGAVPQSPYTQDTWAGGDPTVDDANEADDSVGNGIFDGVESPAIQNSGAGVFESKYAEPGWLYRENLSQPGDIVDANTGAGIMFRPTGGGWHEDMAATYQPYDAEVPREYGPKKAVGALDLSDGRSATLGEWAVAGLIAGAAVALVVATLKVK
jgi:hypothetical protein